MTTLHNVELAQIEATLRSLRAQKKLLERRIKNLEELKASKLAHPDDWPAA